MIDRESIDDLRQAAQICEDTALDLFLVEDDEDIPENAAEVENLLGAAFEEISEAIALLKKA